MKYSIEQLSAMFFAALPAVLIVCALLIAIMMLICHNRKQRGKCKNE